MNCPNCGYDLWEEYEDALVWGGNKWIKITHCCSFFDGEYSGHKWKAECKCPKCKHEWFKWDQDI